MSLLQAIYNWSLTQKPFLRDALRRLLDNSCLSSSDYDDLFALLKLEVGIPDPSKRVPETLDKVHLPSIMGQGTTVRLLALRNLKNVNRIAADQEITFEPAGLTVIYGDNGTGKSGYSRVLKLACRARGEKAPVLPNASLPKPEQGTPEGEIVFDLNGTKTNFKWSSNSKEHPELASLSVFDSHCARAYVDAEHDVAYLPYGLDIVENLANVVLPELSKRLREAIAQCSIDRSRFHELAGSTQVGAMIASLSHSTDPALVETLATFTNEDESRLSSLRITLREQDPKAKAAQLRRLAERMKVVQKNIENSLSAVNDAAVESLKTLVTETNTAIAAESLAVEVFHSGESLLPTTGCEEWQALFEAARQFAMVAYRDIEFPAVDEATRCPLCQEELRNGAARLQRFDKFIKDNAASVAKEKKRQLASALNSLSQKNLSFAIEPSLAEEIALHKPELGPKLQAFETQLLESRKWVLERARTGEWKDRPAIASDPREELTAFIAKLIAEAADHELAANEDTKRALELELSELDAKSKCKNVKDLLLEAIAKLKMASLLSSCSDLVKTTAISNKSKELANECVTKALSDALNREFDFFSLGHIKTQLKSRAKDGKTYHKIALDFPANYKLTEVLSEGELRVIAISSFLAELSLANHSGGAIFDDPVSSLDHFRRAKVARRLADESKKRQVVVFTHDTVFLAELRGIVDREKISAQFWHLEWTTADYSGYCHNGLPWHHQRFVDRIDALEKEQRDLRRDWLPVPNSQLMDRMRNAYSHFRATIERAVEADFLNGVVNRFNNYIPVENINKVIALTPAELAELLRLFKIACDATNAHDPSTGANRPPPSPTELEAHIKELKALVQAFKSRKAAVT